MSTLSRKSLPAVGPGTRPHTRFWTLAAVAFVILCAFALRVSGIGQWPPGLSNDESIEVVDGAYLATTGRHPIYLKDGRPEPLYRLLMAIPMALFGVSNVSGRLLSLFTGIISVALAFRAGRHMALNSKSRFWTGLIAAAMLAIMINHIALSRTAYRGILTPMFMLAAFDRTAAAWKSGKPRTFALAGVFSGIVPQTYTSGLVILPALALLLAYLFVFHRRSLSARWRGLALMLLAALLTLLPLAVLILIQPGFYFRAAEVSSASIIPAGASLPLQVYSFTGRVLNTWWITHFLRGDGNPQYNIGASPLLHNPALWLIYVAGLLACLARWRSLPHVYSLILTAGSVGPIAMSDEIPHGLRVVMSIAVLPLVSAALADLIPALDRTARSVRPWLLGLLTLTLVGSGIQSAHITHSYYTASLVQPGTDIATLSWFFETRREAMADYLGASSHPIYVPLEETSHPAMRVFTWRSHPQTRSVFDYQQGQLLNEALPPGELLIPPWTTSIDTLAVYMPDGTLVWLSRMTDEEIAVLNAQRTSPAPMLLDSQGELAARIYHFPPPGADGMQVSPIRYPSSINYSDQIRLLGWDGPREIDPQAGSINVTVYPSRGPAPFRAWTIYQQLWNTDLEQVSLPTSSLISRWNYYPPLWPPGVPMPMRVSILLPGAGLEAGAYYLVFGFQDYRDENVPVLLADGSAGPGNAIAGTIKVAIPTETLPADLRPSGGVLGDTFVLLGYTIRDSSGQPLSRLSPGLPVLLDLYWQAQIAPLYNEDLTVFVHVKDDAGSLVAQSDIQPYAGRYPTSVWSVGEIVHTSHYLEIPPHAQGLLNLYAGMYRFPELTRLSAAQNGEMSPESTIFLGSLAR